MLALRTLADLFLQSPVLNSFNSFLTCMTLCSILLRQCLGLVSRCLRYSDSGFSLSAVGSGLRQNQIRGRGLACFLPHPRPLALGVLPRSSGVGILPDSAPRGGSPFVAGSLCAPASCPLSLRSLENPRCGARSLRCAPAPENPKPRRYSSGEV